jgi:plastocyanin
MWKWRMPVVVGVVAAAAAIAVGLHEPASNDEAAVVTMGDAAFAPASVRISAGSSVTWRNRSQLVHTVTADPARVQNRRNVSLPAGAEPFHSGNIAAGASYTRRFTVPGTYRYVCVPHEAARMIGTVVVTAD